MNRKKSTNVVALALLIAFIFTLATAVYARLPNAHNAAVSPRADDEPQPVAAEDVTAMGTGIVSEPKGATGEAIYLIRLEEPPLAAYEGGIEGLAPTSPMATADEKLDVHAPASQAYSSYLRAEQAELISGMEDLLNRSVDVVYRYTTANNGIAARMTPDEARLVSGMPGVIFVQRDLERELQTDNGPAWIGAPGIWDGTDTAGLPGTQGEGIIVGVIDTGINPDNPSFADIGPIDGYDHTNPYGSGNYTPGSYCDTTDPSFCNDKLIGAWGYPTVNSGDPTDYDGHGSHTTSTAAGNVVEATVVAPTTSFTRTISGVAPHANIIAYSACCTLSALSAAIDQVITDSVDVVNYSIGSESPSDVWNDFDTVGYLNAREAGIFVATSTGNAGPGSETVGSPADAPWLLSVGATTHDRKFLNSVTGMSGGDTTPPADIDGKSVTAGYGPADIVYAASAGDAQCLDPFPAGTWTNGEIVVCDRGEIARTQKCANVEAGGAAGCVLANTDAQGESINADPHVIPAVHIGDSDGDVLRAWLSSGSGHMATIAGTMLDVDPSNGDIMAGFSSRGANRALPDIIVPSVSAPGVDIIAAYGTGGAVEWNAISGTSMASPHAAGAAALLIALHPEWTPAMVQSALMTTSWTDVLDDDSTTPATYFDMGSGRIDLTDAAEAGFVMDETIANYEAANPDDGGDPKTLNLPSMGNSQCLSECSWTRTISSTKSIPITWTVSVTTEDNIVLTVTPNEFELPAYGTQTIMIAVDVSAATNDVWAFGEVTLSPTATVPFTAAEGHLPVAVLPTSGVLPDTVEINTRRDAGSHLVEDLQSIAITDLTIGNYGLTQASQMTELLSQDPTDGDPYDNLNDGTTFYTTQTVPANAKRLVAEILTSEAPDIDLFVGTGSTPSAATEVCASTTPTAAEYCNVDDPAAGTWWVLVQNWAESASPPDEVTFAWAVVPGADNGNMNVTGPSSVAQSDPYDLRVYWDDSAIVAGDRWYGAFDIATDPGETDNVGTVRVNLTRHPDPVVKSASVANAAVGQTFTYSLTVLPNVTGVDLNYALTDTIPTGLSYVSGSAAATSGSVNVTGNQLTWTGTMRGSRFYEATTSNQDPACAAPFANSGAYVDLEAFGLLANSSISGDYVGFSAFSSGDPINYYGVDYTGMGFTDDGFAIFDFGNYGGDPWIPQTLPDATLPNNVLPAFWHDFEIVYDAAQNYGVTLAVAGDPGGVVVVEYDDIHLFGGSSSVMDFEIAVWRAVDDSPGAYEIIYAYDNISSIPTPATIGVENVLGDRATAVVNSGDPSAIISDGTAICFDWVPPTTPAVITYQVEVVEDSCTAITNTADHAVDNPGSQPATASHDVAPNCTAPSAANLGINSPIDENDTATLSGDINEPDAGESLQLDVDWGDGTATSYTYAAGTASFAEMHQYLDDDPTGTPTDVYTVGLTLSDSKGLSTTTTINLTVDNVPPTVDAGDDVTTDVGVTVTFTGTASDVGTLDTHTYEWDFGDGNTATGPVVSHTYSAEGYYTVNLTVIDDDTGVGTDTMHVIVGEIKQYLPVIHTAPPTPSAAHDAGAGTFAQTAIWASILIGIVLPAGGILQRRR
ncbi:MAG: S8 family serine peptidase [Candidatus Promineifilaceae bacterium]|nr:S8 family serine peptidase [Candidatus Promineifilaceae bacterium]